MTISVEIFVKKYLPLTRITEVAKDEPTLFVAWQV